MVTVVFLLPKTTSSAIRDAVVLVQEMVGTATVVVAYNHCDAADCPHYCVEAGTCGGALGSYMVQTSSISLPQVTVPTTEVGTPGFAFQISIHRPPSHS